MEWLLCPLAMLGPANRFSVVLLWAILECALAWATAGARLFSEGDQPPKERAGQFRMGEANVVEDLLDPLIG